MSGAVEAQIAHHYAALKESRNRNIVRKKVYVILNNEECVAVYFSEIDALKAFNNRVGNKLMVGRLEF